MLFYYILLFIITTIGIISEKKGNKGKNIFIIFIFNILLFLYTVRNKTVGWDTIPYIQYFYNAKDDTIFGSYMEPGWVFLMKSIYKISNQYSVMFFVCGLIGMTVFFYTIKKMSVNPIYSIVLYYMFGNWFALMNQTRTQISVGICMLSFYYLFQKKYLKSFIIVLIAFFIHQSALIFIPFILFDIFIKKYSWKVDLIIGTGTLFLFILYTPVYKFVTKYYYVTYTTTNSLIKHTKEGNLKIFFAFLLIYILLRYVDLHTYKKIDINSTKKNFNIVNQRMKKLLYTAILFSLGIQFISKHNAMIARFSNYFSIYFVVLIPFTFRQISNKRVRKQYMILIYIFLLLYMAVYLKFSENGFGRDGVIPYLLRK